MISIREEIRAIENGEMDKMDNALKNAPHCVLAEEIWNTLLKKRSCISYIHQYKPNFGPCRQSDNAYVRSKLNL